MAKRSLLKIQDLHELFGIPTDEDSLIRHYSLSPADRLEIELRRRKQNQFGFAMQLCLMRYPGRALLPNEVPPPMLLNYIAEQINVDPRLFNLYATREETRREHIGHLQRYLDLRSATAEDRRAALRAGIEAASQTDKGLSIAKAIIATFREQCVLLPAVNMIERMGLAARAIARRRATIVAQLIKLGQKLTDDAVTMFIKLIRRLFSKANNKKKQQHMNARMETSKALRLFLDTIVALQNANDADEDAIRVINREVGWHKLLQIKPNLEAMVENADTSPLATAAEQYANVRKFAGVFLQTFKFHSHRKHDPLLAAISTLKGLYTEGRRVLPDRVPVGHLGSVEKTTPNTMCNRNIFSYL